MSELNERFRVLDRIEVPDLRPHVRIRKPDQTSPRIPLGRLASGLVALAIAGIGVVLVARGFLGGEPGVRRGASPSMDRLAVVMLEGTYVGKGADSIYLVNEDGTGLERIVEGRAPAWSPDGSQIAFRRGNPNRGGGLDTTIYVAGADGSGERVVVTGVSGEASGESGPPVWSPDGRLIAFDTLEGIYVVAPDGSNLRQISRYEGEQSCYDLQPSWSPDGTRLAFAVLCDGEGDGIWTVELDGTDRSQLLSPGSHGIAELTQPAWSPDGTKMAFVGSSKTGPQGESQRDIWVMNADGTGARRVTDGSAPVADPSWSPDGAQIAYWVWNTQGVMIMNADGSDPRPLTEPGFRACCPAWVPSTSTEPTSTPSATGEAIGDEADPAQAIVVPPAQRAGTVAIAAMTQAGLRDPTGSTDYGGVELKGDGWVAHFCFSPTTTGVCTPNLADGFVRLVLDGEGMVVADVTGGFTSEERARLVGYREPLQPPRLEEVFGPVSIRPSPEGLDFLASVYWTGPIPSRSSATCHVELTDEEGRVVYRSPEHPATAPKVEGARDAVFGSIGITEDIDPVDGRVVCGEWGLHPAEGAPRGIPGDRFVLARGEDGGTGWEVFMFEDEKGPAIGWAKDTGEWSYSEKPDPDVCAIRPGRINLVYLRQTDEEAVVMQFHVLPKAAESVRFLLDDGRSVSAEIIRVPDERAPWDVFVAVFDGPPNTSVSDIAIEGQGGARLDGPTNC